MTFEKSDAELSTVTIQPAKGKRHPRREDSLAGAGVGWLLFGLFLAGLMVMWVAMAFVSIDYEFDTTFFAGAENALPLEVVLVGLPLLASFYYFLFDAKVSFTDHDLRLRMKNLIAVSIGALLFFSAVAQVLSDLPDSKPSAWEVVADQSESLEIAKAAFSNLIVVISSVNGFQSWLYLLTIAVVTLILNESRIALAQSFEGKREVAYELRREIKQSNREIAALMSDRLIWFPLVCALNTWFEQQPRRRTWMLYALSFSLRLIADVAICLSVVLLASFFAEENGTPFLLVAMGWSLFIFPAIELMLVRKYWTIAISSVLFGLLFLLAAFYVFWVEGSCLSLLGCFFAPVFIWLVQFLLARKITFRGGGGAPVDSETVITPAEGRELATSDIRFAVGELNKANWLPYNPKKGRVCLLWWFLCLNGRLGYLAAAEIDILLNNRAAACKKLKRVEKELSEATQPSSG